jgi:hypothetical protein
MRAFVTRNTERCEAGAEPGSQAVGCSDEGEDFLFCYFLQHSELWFSERTSELIRWPAFSLQELTIPLKGYVKNFPESQQLHPYEQSLLELTLGPGTYEEVFEISSLQSSVFLSSHIISGSVSIDAVLVLYPQVMILSGGVRCMISYMGLHWTFAADFTTG